MLPARVIVGTGDLRVSDTKLRNSGKAECLANMARLSMRLSFPPWLFLEVNVWLHCSVDLQDICLKILVWSMKLDTHDNV